MRRKTKRARRLLVAAVLLAGSWVDHAEGAAIAQDLTLLARDVDAMRALIEVFQWPEEPRAFLGADVVTTSFGADTPPHLRALATMQQSVEKRTNSIMAESGVDGDPAIEVQLVRRLALTNELIQSLIARSDVPSATWRELEKELARVAELVAAWDGRAGEP
ncbi:MAG: hypothetical protein ACFB6S_18675 [Geminicoccaceae bacterium]